jgi:type IV pilus assembly protein PilM
MFRFLFKSLYEVEPEFFGLDISDESFKFIQLKKIGSDFDIAAFGSSSIKKGIIIKGEVKKEKELTESLMVGLKNPEKGKLTTKYVVCSLPEEHSFIRVLQLPKMSFEETKEAIKWETEQNIPLGIDEVYFDWQVINNLDKKLDHQDILIAAIPKIVVDPYMSVLKNSGFIPIAMEVESISVVRSVIKDLVTDFPELILDIGATRTNFLIFSGMSLRFSSSVSIAGNKMIEAISKEFDIDKKEAKKIFYEVGLNKELDSEGRVAKTIMPYLVELSDQIKNYISFYSSHLLHDHKVKKKNIEKILLSGGVANLVGITAYLSSTLKIPVELANPWTNILKEPLNKVPDMPFKKSLRYTTALGLALRDIKDRK